MKIIYFLILIRIHAIRTFGKQNFHFTPRTIVFDDKPIDKVSNFL